MLPLLLVSVALADAPLDGTWALETDLAEVRAVQKAATDRALVSLPSLLRPIADHLLAPTYRVCATYTLARTATFSVQCESNAPIASPLDNQTRTVEVAGEPRQVSLQADGDAVVLTIHDDHGARTTRYAPSATGLHVSVSVTSSHLDAPIAWDLDYRAVP